MTERRANELAIQLATGLFAIIILTFVVLTTFITLLKAFGVSE